MRRRFFSCLSAIGIAVGLCALPAAAQTPAATYPFNNTLAAQQGGVPALTQTDPLASNNFGSAVVFGSNRTVFNWVGTNSPPTQQAGLSVNTTSFITNGSSYSAELVFQFTQNAGAWGRILDVENRQSDNGFYVDPSNTLDVFPVSGSAGAFPLNTFFHVVLTVDSNTIVAYLNGAQQFSLSSSVMNINNANNPSNIVNLFLDNLVGGGQGEYSNGSIALFKLYNGALTAPQVAVLASNPFAGPASSAAPEPTSLGFVVLAAVGMGWRIVRRRRAA